MAEALTVVVVALLGGKAVNQCVEALREECDTILVVHRDGTVADGSGRIIGMSERLDIPAKRRSAVELAATPFVALIEDTVVPMRGWAAAVIAALRQEDVVGCGGPVDAAAGLPPQTQALILSDYGKYNRRRPAGTVVTLPGCNFAFLRDALNEALSGSDGMVDLPVFARLAQANGKLVWAPDAAVLFSHPYPNGARLRTRFDHGRIYASSKAGLIGRAVTAIKAFPLPAVLTVRAVRDAGIGQLRSIGTLGWLLMQHTAWAAGEFVGAVLGPSPKGLGEWQ